MGPSEPVVVSLFKGRDLQVPQLKSGGEDLLHTLANILSGPKPGYRVTQGSAAYSICRATPSVPATTATSSG